MVRFFAIFVALLTTLFTLRITTWGHDWVTEPFTGVLAWICAHLVKLWDPNVISYGVVIQNKVNQFAVGIAPGCDGIEAVIILTSAVLAFPAPWKHKIAGIVVGFFAIQLLNIVRIISLFYMGQWNQTLFDWFHLYLWQALIVLDALAVWLVWLRYLPRKPRVPPKAPPAAPAVA